MLDDRTIRRNASQQLRDEVPSLRDLELELGHGGVAFGPSMTEWAFIRLLSAPVHLRRAIADSILLDVALARRRRQQSASRALPPFAVQASAGWRRDRHFDFVLLLIRLCMLALQRSLKAPNSPPIWALYDAAEEIVDFCQSYAQTLGVGPSASGAGERGQHMWEDAWCKLRLEANAAWTQGGERPDPAATMPTALLPYIQALMECVHLELPNGNSLAVMVLSPDSSHPGGEDLERPRAVP